MVNRTGRDGNLPRNRIRHTLPPPIRGWASIKILYDTASTSAHLCGLNGHARRRLVLRQVKILP